MYNLKLFDEATKLAYKSLKTSTKKIKQENFEETIKIAVMFIKTRESSEINEFQKFIDSFSFPKLERIRKLNLFDNFLVE